MKVKVKELFRDINRFSKMYYPGEVVDFDPERAKDIVAKGLGEFPEKPEQVKKPRKKSK